MDPAPLLNRHAESGDLAGLPYVLDTDGRLEFRCGDHALAQLLLYQISWMMHRAKQAQQAQQVAPKAHPAPVTAVAAAPAPVPKAKPVEAAEPTPEPKPAPVAVEPIEEAEPAGDLLLPGESIIAGCVRLITALGEPIHYKELAAELNVNHNTMRATIARDGKSDAPQLVRTRRGTYSTPEIEPVAVVAEPAPEQQAAPEPIEEAKPVAVVAAPEPEPVAAVEEPEPAPAAPRQFTQASIDKLIAQAASMHSPMQVIMLLQQSIDTTDGIAKFIDTYKGSIPVFASMPSAQVIARIGTLAASVIH